MEALFIAGAVFLGLLVLFRTGKEGGVWPNSSSHGLDFSDIHSFADFLREAAGFLF